MFRQREVVDLKLWIHVGTILNTFRHFFLQKLHAAIKKIFIVERFYECAVIKLWKISKLIILIDNFEVNFKMNLKDKKRWVKFLYQKFQISHDYFVERFGKFSATVISQHSATSVLSKITKWINANVFIRSAALNFCLKENLKLNSRHHSLSLNSQSKTIQHLLKQQKQTKRTKIVPSFTLDQKLQRRCHQETVLYTGTHSTVKLLCLFLVFTWCLHSKWDKLGTFYRYVFK